MERFDLQMFQCIIMKSKQISLKLGMQNVFTKGYVPNWSEEVFVIKKFKNTVLWTYDISNLNGEEIGIIGGVGLLLFLRPKFGYLLQNLPANVFYELLEGKIVENKKTKFSHAKQIFFTFFRNTNEYEY